MGAFGNAMRPLQRCCGAMMAALAALCLLPRCVAQGTVDDPQLLGSTMVIRRSKMYVFGGMGTNSTVPQNILWEFDMNARSWTWVTPQSEDKPAGTWSFTGESHASVESRWSAWRRVSKSTICSRTA